MELHRAALEQSCHIDNRLTELEAWYGLAVAELRLGRPEVAREHARQALSIAARAGYRIVENRVRTVLAEILLAGGEPTRAATCARRALAGHRRTGYRLGEARALHVLGLALREAADREAPDRLAESAALPTELGAAGPAV